MKTVEYSGDLPSEPRSHPWTDSVASSESRYYDLRVEPELIRSSLEDFVPWSHYEAVTRFYEILERINGTGSVYESNDCAFSSPGESEAPGLGDIQCSGRLMILYRDLILNTSKPRIETLARSLHIALAEIDPDLEPGIVGTTLVPVRLLELPASQQLGHQLMISFWAWGSSEADAMKNLDRVLRNLSQALGGLDA